MTEKELKEFEDEDAPPHGSADRTISALTNEVRRLQNALTATRLDVGHIIDALLNAESLHEDECPEDDTCDCELVKRINLTYERLREFRE